MDKQPEALRLADHLQEYWDNYDQEYHAAAELRRLHQVNQELVEALNQIMWTRPPNRNPSRYAHTIEEIAFRALAKHAKLKEQV